MTNSGAHWKESYLKTKKTLLDYHRNIDRAAFDGFKFGFKIANERMLKDGRLERTFQD